jgi:hypothetical protein
MTSNFDLSNQRRFCLIFASYLLSSFASPTAVVVAQEAANPIMESPAELPPPQNLPPAGDQNVPDRCQPVPYDKPLGQLDTDIQPRHAAPAVAVGSQPTPIAASDLPYSCSAPNRSGRRTLNFALCCESCYPSYCDILALAHFCHRPLYFNDDCLERCGCQWCCCQPAGSAACFYGGALLMPVRAVCQCPCSCVPSGGCCR